MPVDGRTDEELLGVARVGDRAALEQLLERHQQQVFRFGMKMCGAEEDAKDVLQDTFLAAARGIRDFRGASSLSTWLFAIARSFCVKHRRPGKFAPPEGAPLQAGSREARDVPDAGRGPEEQAAGEQVRAALQEAIARLDPLYREVLVLRDVEGLAAAEVAEVMGITVEAVKSRLHRARIAVRRDVAPALGILDARPLSEEPACPDVVALFSRHLEGEISGTVCATLEAHLKACPRCTARCDSLRATLMLCSRSGEEVPPRVASSVRASLHRFLQQQG